MKLKPRTFKCSLNYIFSGLLFITLASSSQADDRTVNCPTNNLQTEINLARPGDSLLISGTCVGSFTIDKNLTLKGKPTGTLDGNNAGTVVTINSGVTATIDTLTITKGTGIAGGGGGILNQGNLTVINSTLDGNLTNGILNAVGATLSVSNSTVSGNHIGISISQNSSAEVINSTIANNIGSGISLPGGELILQHSTLSGDNTALEVNSGGIATINSSVMDSTAICNIIVNFGRITSTGFNLIGVLNLPQCVIAGGFIPDPNNTDIIGTPAVPINPLLGALTDNGGPTLTMALLPDSPAINVIPPASCLLTTDQRGEPRPGVGKTNCDIGAYETQAQVPPSDQIAAILALEKTCQDNGDLIGKAPNNNAQPGRIKAWVNMLKRASGFINNNDFADACEQLQNVLDRADGLEPPQSPPDFVQNAPGSKAQCVEILVEDIKQLRTDLGCSP